MSPRLVFSQVAGSAQALKLRVYPGQHVLRMLKGCQ